VHHIFERRFEAVVVLIWWPRLQLPSEMVRGSAQLIRLRKAQVFIKSNCQSHTVHIFSFVINAVGGDLRDIISRGRREDRLELKGRVQALLNVDHNDPTHYQKCSALYKAVKDSSYKREFGNTWCFVARFNQHEDIDRWHSANKPNKELLVRIMRILEQAPNDVVAIRRHFLRLTEHLE